MLQPLEAYFRLLSRWNARINLTALPLSPPTDAALDRLLIEPLVAARSIPAATTRWFDLGSGGGSPAIPLKIARPTLVLTMVESKVRKAAFLREAIRTLGLSATVVENARHEALAGRSDVVGQADLVTVRAVKTDSALFTAAAQMLKPGGQLLLFRADDHRVAVPGFRQICKIPLVPGGTSQVHLAIFERVFHVEQSG